MKKKYMKPETEAEKILLTQVIALSEVDGEATSTDTPLVNERDDWGDMW